MRNRNRQTSTEQPEKETSTFELELPEAREMSFMTGALVFTGVAFVGISIGAVIATQVFIGTAALLGLAVMTERYPAIKYVIQRSNMAIDIIIFAGSIYAVATLGVTIAGGLTVLGLGYTTVLAPHVRKSYRNRKARMS